MRRAGSQQGERLKTHLGTWPGLLNCGADGHTIDLESDGARINLGALIVGQIDYDGRIGAHISANREVMVNERAPCRAGNDIEIVDTLEIVKAARSGAESETVSSYTGG